MMANISRSLTASNMEILKYFDKLVKCQKLSEGMDSETALSVS